MADETPPPSPETPPAGDSAASLAEQALRAAQAAVASLQQNADPTAANPAASAVDDAMAAAFAEAEAEGNANMAAPAVAAQAPRAPELPTRPLDLPAFDRTPAAELPKGIDLLSDVNLNVKIELGRTRMLVEDVLKLNEGAVVELDKLAGDPVDVYVNERHIARGEVLVLNDNFCVRINEIVADVTDGQTPGGKGGGKR